MLWTALTQSTNYWAVKMGNHFKKFLEYTWIPQFEVELEQILGKPFLDAVNNKNTEVDDFIVSRINHTTKTICIKHLTKKSK